MRLSSFLAEIAERLRDTVIPEPFSFKRRLFLCGKSLKDKSSLRYKLKEFFRTTSSWWYKYEVYYPETLFEDLGRADKGADLLTLENLLAESVDAVIIPLESPGTIAELGAFANHAKLRRKLVVINDTQFQRSRSFISLGPLRLLTQRNEGVVLSLPFAEIDKHYADVTKAIDRVRREGTERLSYWTPLTVDVFLLLCIYLLEPLERSRLNFMVRAASGLTKSRAHIVATAGVTQLIREGQGIASSQGLMLTEKGLERLNRLGTWGSKRTQFVPRALDRLRLRVLTVRESRRYKGMWQEVLP